MPYISEQTMKEYSRCLTFNATINEQILDVNYRKPETTTISSVKSHNKFFCFRYLLILGININQEIDRKNCATTKIKCLN